MSKQEVKENNIQTQERFIVKQREGLIKELKPKFSIAKEGYLLTDRLKRDYHNQRLNQSKWAFRLSFCGAIIGFIVIIYGLKKSVDTNNTEWITIISGSMVEIIAVLFFYLNNRVNDKISEFFKELIVDSNKKDAQSLIHEIKNSDIRDELIVKLALHLSGINDERICKNVKEICRKTNEDDKIMQKKDN